jgi:hypothetical protein
MADFNASPYWDDFEATNGALEKNYMRILFRPGFAVQARELTQIQSILQNQIKQFGDHIFQDGSPVIGGHLTLDTSINYVKLNPQFAGNDIDLEDFFGLTVFNSGAPKTRAKVIQTYSTTADRTLMVKYLRGTSFTSGQTISTAGGNSANVTTTAPTGTGSVVSINQGVFYVDGYFVTVAPQTIVLEPYSSTPTYRVGLEIDEEIVTESVDNALLDPAQEAFNYQAPGAHRYQFSLVLAKRTLDSVDDSRFFELLRVENGVITRQVSYPIYSELEKTFARRTYDESGNYAVKPFRVNITANTPIGQSENTSTFIINVEPGKAYVKGFEFETIGTRKISADRARNYKSSKDYNLSVYYGNRIQLANVQGSTTNGIIFSDNLDEVDIHCVANNQVDLSSGESSKYYATRIGTAKLRNLDRTSSASIYYAYLTDVNYNPFISMTGAQSPNVTSVNLGSHFSSTNDAYVGGTVTMIDQISGEYGIITNYNGTTKVAVLDRQLSQTIVVNQRFSLSMPVSTSESIMVANTTSLTSANLQANVSSTSKDILGSASIQDTSFNRMVFELPNYYIRYNSDLSVDLYRRKIIKNQSFTTNGALTLALTGSETYDFGVNGSVVSDADLIENIIVVPTTGTTPGRIVDLTAGAANVKRTTSQSIDICTDSASGTDFTGDVYVTVKITNANGSFRRNKTLIQSNSALTAGDTLSSSDPVLGYTDVELNTSNGIAWYTSSSVIARVPGEKQSLFVSDVVKIKKIYDSGDITQIPSTTNMIDITDRYTFDSGQTDNYYDHAAIILKPGASAPKGQTAVLFDYYTHTGTGYLSAKSYDSTIYDEEKIPVYKSISGKNYNLRDCIDLRPFREPGTSVTPYSTAPVDARVNVASGGTLVQSNTALSSNILTPPIVTGSIIKIGNDYRTVNSVINLTAVTVSSSFSASSTNTAINMVFQNYDFNGSIIQRPTDPMELDYDYYLPRIDKLIVTKDKEFKVLNGVPSLTPKEPIENEDSMAIYTLYIPPYTASLQSIDLKYIDNRRYTMKDISVMDKRLAEVENFIALKQSEQDLIQDPPKSPITPEVNKPIYGTLVDEFNDLTIADTNNDFACSIENGKLSAYKNITTFSLKPATTGNNIRDKFVTIPYTESSFAEQKLSTTGASETVQSTMIAKFEGFVTLTPESDYFYSLEHQPYITDSIGRYFELRQTQTTPASSLTDNVIETIGGGGYYSTTYYDSVISGRNSPISVSSTVSVPHYAGPASDIDPRVTQQLDINLAGVAPETFLNSTWAGTQRGFGQSAVENIFTPDWTQDGFLTAQSFGKFDDF